MVQPRNAGCALSLFLIACLSDRPVPPQADEGPDSEAYLDEKAAPERSRSARGPASVKASGDVVTHDAGASLYTDTARPFEVAARAAAGLGGDEMDVRVFELRAGRGGGVLIFYRQPATGYEVMRILGLDAGRLRPLGPRLAVNGRFAPLLESSEPHVRFLLPGERFDVEVWQGHFTIVVPYRVRLSGCTPALQPCIREGVRRGDIVPGLSLLPVLAERRALTRDTTVILYDAPEGRSPTHVAVRPDTPITIMEVAAEVYTEPDGSVSVIRTRREWLRVRIDAREGWLSGADSFGAIGLPAR